MRAMAITMRIRPTERRSPRHFATAPRAMEGRCITLCRSNITRRARDFETRTKRGRKALIRFGGVCKLRSADPQGAQASGSSIRSRPPRESSPGGAEQRGAIKMRLAMVGEPVERPLDRRLVVDPGRRAEKREPGRALAVVAEQAMHVSPRYATVR